MTELETPRLLLRPVRLDDAPRYALGIGEYEVARWLTSVPWPYTIGMALDWLRSAPDNRPARAMFGIDLPGKGLIGSITLMGEMGFWIARPHWGKGYVSEAAAALIDWHFDGCDSLGVTSSAHRTNAASLRVQAKLGFVEERREMRFSQALQGNIEHVVTRLTREDWLARGERRCA